VTICMIENWKAQGLGLMLALYIYTYIPIPLRCTYNEEE
jgi:hypothetical protein